MDSRSLKRILDKTGLIDNICKGLDINKETVKKHSSMLSQVTTKLNNYQKDGRSEELMKTYSPPEKQALYQNVQNLYKTYQELNKELEYLEMTKHPSFLQKAIEALDKAYLVIEYMYKNILGECGDLVPPKLTCIKLKYIDQSTYTQMIYSLMTELEAFVHDIYEDYIHAEFNTELLTFIPAYSNLVEAYMWIQKENERLKVEALPEIRKIEIPAEIFPEIPKNDANQKQNEESIQSSPDVS